MGIIFTILSFLLMLIIIGGAYALGRTYIFTKVQVNKWIILGITVALFIAQLVCQYALKITNGPLNMAFTILIVFFLFWFMDILQTGGPKRKEKKIVIKPKAKPNRVKNRKK